MGCFEVDQTEVTIVKTKIYTPVFKNVVNLKIYIKYIYIYIYIYMLKFYLNLQICTQEINQEFPLLSINDGLKFPLHSILHKLSYSHDKKLPSERVS